MLSPLRLLGDMGMQGSLLVDRMDCSSSSLSVSHCIFPRCFYKGSCASACAWALVIQSKCTLTHMQSKIKKGKSKSNKEIQCNKGAFNFWCRIFLQLLLMTFGHEFATHVVLKLATPLIPKSHVVNWNVISWRHFFHRNQSSTGEGGRWFLI